MAGELYIYGIMAGDHRLDFGKIGIEGREVFTLGRKDVACVVSDSPSEEYVADNRNTSAHARVLEHLVQRHSMLPMRFGTVAPSERDVLSFLKSHRKDIKRLLKKLSGKVEVELEILWKDMKPIFSKIGRSNGTLRKLRKLSREKTREELIMAGELVSRLLHEKKEVEGKKFIKALKSSCEDYRITPSPLDEVILNASFLIDSKKLEKFDRAADAISDEYADELRIKYIGPISPCSFVSLHM